MYRRSLCNCRGWSATPFCLVFITDCRPYTRLSTVVSGTIFPSTSLQHLRCSSSGHVSRLTFNHFLSQSFTLYSARAVIPVILDTLIVRVTYLHVLTYLLLQFSGPYAYQMLIAAAVALCLLYASERCCDTTRRARALTGDANTCVKRDLTVSLFDVDVRTQ